ncbi:hypothetical protein STCU_11679 [Strigomonas culicis]|uniref:Uncharacterized protein n=1 Tax=Strigomonas culicis TaxID=28005 RepID=S9UZC1_9TRYP|nr:hypothetical protein STCU_11679 [Strigomonas culicis]|eukprot:EPY15910.1 hypothetical protein STCU_11679 [Strigomonas culicis]
MAAKEVDHARVLRREHADKAVPFKRQEASHLLSSLQAVSKLRSVDTVALGDAPSLPQLKVLVCSTEQQERRNLFFEESMAFASLLSLENDHYAQAEIKEQNRYRFEQKRRNRIRTLLDCQKYEASQRQLVVAYETMTRREYASSYSNFRKGLPYTIREIREEPDLTSRGPSGALHGPRTATTARVSHSPDRSDMREQYLSDLFPQMHQYLLITEDAGRNTLMQEYFIAYMHLWSLFCAKRAPPPAPDRPQANDGHRIRFPRDAHCRRSGASAQLTRPCDLTRTHGSSGSFGGHPIHGASATMHGARRRTHGAHPPPHIHEVPVPQPLSLPPQRRSS